MRYPQNDETDRDRADEHRDATGRHPTDDAGRQLETGQAVDDETRPGDIQNEPGDEFALERQPRLLPAVTERSDCKDRQQDAGELSEHGA